MHIHHQIPKSRFGAAATVVPLLIGILATGVADATPPDLYAAPSQVVRFQDLNLSEPNDVARLYRRIAHAAQQLCWSSLSSAETAPLRHFDRCFDAAMAQATADVGNPALIALYRSGSIVAAR